MEKDSKTTPRKRKKVDDSEYDTYVANVSNGLNPPSQAKRRRKKKPDTDAFDRFLEESEGAPMESRRSRRERDGRMRVEPDASAPKKRRSPDPMAEDMDLDVHGRPKRAGRGADDLALDAIGKKPGKKAVKKPKKPSRKMDDYDAYLLNLEASDALLPKEPGEARAPKPKRSAKRRRRKSNPAASAAYVAAMAVILAGFGLFGWNQVRQYQRFQNMRAVVDNQSFYEGTKVDGVDVSGMTLAEAEAYFANSVEPMYANRSVSLTTGEMYTAEQLGYSSNYHQVLRAAWGSGRSGSLEERYQAITSGAHLAETYEVTRTFCSESAVRAAVDEVAARVAQDASEPEITGFDVDTLEFTFTEGQPGHDLDEEKLVSDIQYVMNAGGGSVEALITAIQPSVQVEDIASQYGRISYISTSAATSKQNRLTNLRLACEAINGYRLDPGEEFSFNGVVGKRTAEKGYQVAGVYSSGAAAQGIGGGICQVGSTLFNAAVMADMEITQRSPHSLPVSYLDKGKDAAIDWPNQDLKFVNTGDSPVYIVARLTDDKQVECAVYGKYLENGISITLESKTTASISYDTVQKLDTSLPSGTSKTKEGHKGYKATTWKVVWDANGNEISRDVLCYSTYPKADTVISYNP